MPDISYDTFVRNRITELRIEKGVSEHRMSLDLGKSGSYIRGVTSGIALPSLRELFNIMDYLGVSAVEFFAPSENIESPYQKICEKLRSMNDEDLDKVATFLGWIIK